MKSYTFGWIQNPSDFLKLKKVVEIFDSNSNQYSLLKNEVIDEVIYHKDDKVHLQNLLNNNVTEFSYTDLVGTSRDKYNNSPKSRKDAIANSLIQVTIEPQSSTTSRKKFTDNWTSDGFLRWGVSLNFITYDHYLKKFKITPHGLKLTQSSDELNSFYPIIEERILSYPPALQILYLLHENPNNYHTKFYLGSNLGFQGEPGFTSYNEEVMFDYLYHTLDKDRSKVRSDVEGTADKYARMIANWLIKLGLVESKRLAVTKIINGEKISFTGYKITGKGLHIYRRSQTHIKEKFIMWEFLTTKAPDGDYIRTRRAHILKKIQSTTSWNSLIAYLNKLGFVEMKNVIKQDLIGLKLMGLRLEFNDKNINFKDKINDFHIPKINVTKEIAKKNITVLKENIINNTNLPPQYYELIDIAYDGQRNRDFEIKSIELFKNIYNINAILLGGSRRPDGIISEKNYGVLIDTKAYKDGYRKNISQQDQMQRYINENTIRDVNYNENEWWKEFDSTIPSNNYYFLWISSKFIGDFHTQLSSLSYKTNIKGGAMNVEQLLIGADLINKGEFNRSHIPKLFDNKEIFF